MKNKGISAVIATILMLTIVIALAGSAYMYISGVFTARVAQTFSIVDTYQNIITIRNDGTVPITSITATLNGNPVSLFMSSTVQPGQIATVKPLATLSRGSHNIRLCTASMCNSGILTLTETIGRSCKDILDTGNSIGNGVYKLSPDTTDKVFSAYCDMTYDGGGWTLVMKSLADNSDFHYGSAHWTTSSVLNENDFDLTNNINSKYDSFNTVPVSEVLIDMNGVKRKFSLKSIVMGKTLLELTSATADATEETNEEIRGGYWCPSSYWSLTANGHECYICHNLGFNYRYWAGCSGYTRIGFSISQEYPCGHPGTAEGIGVREECYNKNLNSGRVQWAGESSYFGRALIYVR